MYAFILYIRCVCFFFFFFFLNVHIEGKIEMSQLSNEGNPFCVLRQDTRLLGVIYRYGNKLCVCGGGGGRGIHPEKIC